MLLTPGTRLGPYEILAPIGAGGMGEVYKARDTRLDRFVAIKVSRTKFSERFEREARAVSALSHPNTCQLYDVGPNYLVMEFIEGSPLPTVENARKLLDLAVQTADGMAAAHAAGLVHRDLKPDNILVTREGRVKILDFGLAKSAVSAQGAADAATLTMSITDPGTTAGTISYMSPEQARGEPNRGKVLYTRTRKVKNRIAISLRIGASCLHHAQNYLGEFYRGMKRKLGAPKAVTATAHKLARIIYHLLRTRAPYDESIFAEQDESALRQAELRLRKHAAKLGFRIVSAETSSEA
ncbi:MAG: protein kinase [Bryobacteraceae bacterium]